ncbi:MAG: hypothetical protein IIB17_09620 [Chloroflexi bacterium]|nr:hypothetical protein [Chloroflexota bacterium]
MTSPDSENGPDNPGSVNDNLPESDRSPGENSDENQSEAQADSRESAPNETSSEPTDSKQSSQPELSAAEPSGAESSGDFNEQADQDLVADSHEVPDETESQDEDLPEWEPLTPEPEPYDAEAACSGLDRWRDDTRPYTCYAPATLHADETMLQECMRILRAAKRGLLVIGQLTDGA